MNGQLRTRVPADTNRIRLNEGWEVTYWTRQLDASEEELAEAIRHVGDSLAAVRGHLRHLYHQQNQRAASGP